MPSRGLRPCDERGRTAADAARFGVEIDGRHERVTDERADDEQQQPIRFRGEELATFFREQPRETPPTHVRARNTSSTPPSAEIRFGAKLLERSFAGDSASAEQHETIADARGVRELMDRQKQRASRGGVFAQHAHDVARLPEVQSVERFVEHEERLRRQQSHGEHDAPVLALRELTEPRGEQRLEPERESTISSR